MVNDDITKRWQIECIENFFDHLTLSHHLRCILYASRILTPLSVDVSFRLWTPTFDQMIEHYNL